MPFTSALIADCIDKHRNWHAGGAHCNVATVSGVGVEMPTRRKSSSILAAARACPHPPERVQTLTRAAVYGTLLLGNWAASIIEQHHDDKGII